MPEPSAPSRRAKTAGAQLRSDREVIKYCVETLRSPDAAKAEVEAAQLAIATRVLRPLKVIPDAQRRKVLSTLTAGLLGNGMVGLLGIERAIESVAASKGLTKDQLVTVTPAVVERLDKLV